MSDDGVKQCNNQKKKEEVTKIFGLRLTRGWEKKNVLGRRWEDNNRCMGSWRIGEENQKRGIMGRVEPSLRELV